MSGRTITQQEAWCREVAQVIEQQSREAREKAARKQAVEIERIAQTRSPLGRFLRSDKGKRLAKSKRAVRWVSIPKDLDRQLDAEAKDVGLSTSRFLAVCLALGAAQWSSYRRLLMEGPNGESPVPMPKLVEHIFANASNPAVKPYEQTVGWQKSLHDAIMTTLKPKSHKVEKDPTEAVLRGTGFKQ